MTTVTRLLGIWPMHERSMRVGELLLFCEELAIQRALYRCEESDICLFGERVYASETITSMLNGLAGTGRVWIAQSRDNISQIIEAGSYVCYPQQFPAPDERI